MAKVPSVTLSSCGDDIQTMPVIGMGTSSYPRADPETAKAAILEAIRAGYRHFDTAAAYGSEKDLGEAIAEALRLQLIKSRDELFITTKLWASFAEKDLVLPSIKASLRGLCDGVDMKKKVKEIEIGALGSNWGYPIKVGCKLVAGEFTGKRKLSIKVCYPSGKRSAAVDALKVEKSAISAL